MPTPVTGADAWGPDGVPSMATESRPLAKKLCQYVPLSEEELAVLHGLENQVEEIERQAKLINEGDQAKRCFVILDGWVDCYKQLPDGRRQVINFMIAGDFLGLRSLLLQVSDHTVTALTNLRVSIFSADELRAILSDHPRIATAIFWALSRDEAIVVEHLVNLGRRNALERLAHFIIELGERLKLVGLAADDGFYCPLRQEDFADVLGLTAIHVNRCFRELRERRLATLVRRNIRIDDRAGLVGLAQFSGDYLASDAPHD
jgi:CRP-like cAMP-binding protein